MAMDNLNRDELPSIEWHILLLQYLVSSLPIIELGLLKLRRN